MVMGLLNGAGLGRKVKTTLGTTVRRPARGSAPNVTIFPMLMEIGGTGITFRAVSLVNGDFNLVVYYTVQAQEEAAWGVGEAGLPDNQGYAYFQLQTTAPAAIDGPTRFVIEDAHGATVDGGVYREDGSTRLDGSAADRRLQQPFPRKDVWATEDSRLAVRINPTATATVTSADSTVQLPVSLRHPS